MVSIQCNCNQQRRLVFEEEVTAIREKLLKLSVIQSFHDIVTHLERENKVLFSMSKPVAKLNDKTVQEMAQVSWYTETHQFEYPQHMIRR